MDLCQLCQEINLYTLGAFFHDYGTTREIGRSRDQLSDDCALCQLFLNPDGSLEGMKSVQKVESVVVKADDRYAPDPAHLLSMAKSSLAQSYRVWLSRLGWIQYYPMSRISVAVRYNDLPFPIPMNLDVFLDQDSTAEARSYVAGRAIQAANSDSNLEQVAGWLGGCLQGHSFCHTGVSGRHFDDDPQTTVLPDRVIDVGSPTVQPHLLETNGKTGRYVALSYCWEPVAPGTKPFSLVPVNKSDLCERLPLSEVPPTIRDAIDFTRRLGISYIWIDRLCIIQGDEDDWKAQAAKMCDIYEGASLTIAALAAKTRDEGLYLPRESQPSMRIRCATKDKDLGYMRITRSFDPGPGYGPELEVGTAFAQELGMSNWDTRGWVMQERLISRRIVYFGRRQLFWECQEMTCKEDGIQDGSEFLDAGDGSPKRDLYGKLADYQLSARLNGILPMFVGTADPIFWYGVIKDYTSRDLTYGRDKEKAMAGIAQAIKLRLGIGMPDYAYGVFLRYVDRLLLWHWKRGFLEKPENSRAPSWSWMAYDGQIRILKPTSISRGIGDCSFVDSASVRSLGVITPAGVSDPVGLKIREARILPMQWLAETSPQTPQIDAWLRSVFESFDVLSSSFTGIGSYLLLPKLIQKNREFKKRSLDSPTPNRFTLGVDAAHAICGFIKFDLEEYSTHSSTVSCLIVCEEAERKKWWKWNQETDGRRVYHLLALEEVRLSPDAKIPVYRRIGVAQTIWAGELGFPIHENATSREILLI